MLHSKEQSKKIKGKKIKKEWIKEKKIIYCSTVVSVQFWKLLWKSNTTNYKKYVQTYEYYKNGFVRAFYKNV